MLCWIERSALQNKGVSECFGITEVKLSQRGGLPCENLSLFGPEMKSQNCLFSDEINLTPDNLVISWSVQNLSVFVNVASTIHTGNMVSAAKDLTIQP